MVSLLGLLAGGVVNALADDLPAGRAPNWPKYPDGRHRPLLAWLGVTAFALRLRSAPKDETEEPSGELDSIRLSWRYPLVELMNAVLMLLTFLFARERRAFSGEETLLLLAMVAMFMLISVIDWEHMRIPVSPLLACCLLALVRALAFPHSPPTIASMLVGALIACLSFALIYLGGRLFVRLAVRSQHQPNENAALGRGDVYLMTVGGLIVGFPNILVAMALTILLGGIGALAYLLVKNASGGYRRFTALPYAPYMLASIYLVALLRDEVSRLVFGI